MGYQAALIVLSIIAILLLIPPFLWHIKTSNIPAITLIVWLLLMDIKILVDAIIWGGINFDDVYDGVGYCDVMVKLQVGANVGISSSITAIMYNLFRILKADSAIPGLKSFKKISIDLSISLITPIIVMALNYLVQSARYSIFRYSGCQNALTLSWVTVVVYSIWLVIWSLIGVIYSVLIIWTFFRKRKDVKDILKCTNSGLNLVRFAKLLIFCIVVIMVMFPLSIYIFTNNLNQVEGSYDFKMIHSNAIWFTIFYVPLEAPYYITWIYLSISYTVFIFFGLGSDAIKMYLVILKKLGFKRLINRFERKSKEKKLLKADRFVSGVLQNHTHNNNSWLNTSSTVEGTSFDIEMQKIINESEKSPTETTISNIFADKYEIPNNERDQYRNYENMDGTLSGLDADDLKYLEMLYEEERLQEESSKLHDES